MTRTDIRAHAIRFADLWAIDPHQMVEEIYAPDILMERMSLPNRYIHGATELHAVEDELASRIPEHRHELVRVVAGEGVACIESMVVAPLTHEYAPACVWWWFDADGMVAAEVGWFDWNVRCHDSTVAHGTVPPSRPSAVRDAGWFPQVADEYARGWATDPTGSALDQFHADCTFGRVGLPEGRGREQLTHDRARSLDQLPVGERLIDVHQVLGDGDTVALLVVIGNVERASRGTVVLTFDAADRIVSERWYWDWGTAFDRSELARRTAVGSPGWTLDDD